MALLVFLLHSFTSQQYTRFGQLFEMADALLLLLLIAFI